METGIITVFENFNGIAPLVTFIQTKEVFISNTFVKIPFALICLQKNCIERAEIEVINIKSPIVFQDTIYNFAEQNSDVLSKLHKECLDLGYDLSWLQAMQVLYLQKNASQSLSDILLELDKFYNKHIISELELIN